MNPIGQVSQLPSDPAWNGCNWKWTINGIHPCHLNNNLIKSPIFSSNSLFVNAKWQLFLHINSTFGNIIVIGLRFLSGNGASINCNYRLSIFNSANEKIKEIDRSNKFKEGEEDKILDFTDTHKLNYNLIKNNMAIICAMSIASNFKVPECRLSDDMGELLDNEKFCDVTLTVGSEKIQAHKNILAARSPVFAAMFEYEMDETKRNRVDITDVDHEVLREMLRYIYTGRAPNIAKLAKGLLVVADKYALDRLKKMCEAALSGNLSVETSVDTLILADRHSMEQLKAQAINFINKKPVEVMKTAGWKDVVTSHSHILEELYHALATRPATNTQSVDNKIHE